MTGLSSGHNLPSHNDATLERLLDLDGEIMEVGNGFWIKIEAVRVDPTPDRPHGLRYSLCLFDPDSERVVGFDNAHPVKVGSGPATRTTGANDHVHGRRRVRPYDYTNAEALMKDFWTAVDQYLRKAGVP